MVTRSSKAVTACNKHLLDEHPPTSMTLAVILHILIIIILIYLGFNPPSPKRRAQPRSTKCNASIPPSSPSPFSTLRSQTSPSSLFPLSVPSPLPPQRPSRHRRQRRHRPARPPRTRQPPPTRRQRLMCRRAPAAGPDEPSLELLDMRILGRAAESHFSRWCATFLSCLCPLPPFPMSSHKWCFARWKGRIE